MTTLITNAIAYYRLDEADNTFAGNAFDAIGTRNLIAHGSATLHRGLGIINNGALFVSSASNCLDNLTAPITIIDQVSVSCWFKTTQTPGSGNDIELFGCTDSSNVVQFMLFLNPVDGHVGIRVTDSNGISNVSTAGNLSDGNWHHAVGTKSGNLVTIYIDGVYVASNSTYTYTGTFTGGLIRMGSIDSATYFYNGALDEACIWNRQLSNNEVAELYNNGRGLTYPFQTFQSSVTTSPTLPLPTFRTAYGADIGIELFFQLPDITGNEKSYLLADTVASLSVLPASGGNFAVNQYIIIGQIGNSATEIVQVASTTATTITIVTPTIFAHNRGDIVRFIAYNQIAPETSFNNGVSFSPQTTIAIRPDSTETYLQYPTDLVSYLYRYRFYNSTTGFFTAYSDVVSGGGYADNTIYAIKQRALDQMGEAKGELITDKFLNDSIQEARRMADMNPAIFRWSFRTQFGSTVGQMLAGQWSIPAPADLRDRNTYKNILSIRIGNQNRPIGYQNRVRFNQNYLNVRHATNVNPVLATDTTIQLSSTHDFDQSGVVVIAGGIVGQGYLTLNYTGNNLTSNTLTGVTGIPLTGYPAGLDVWQQAVFGLPTAYTIDKGMIYFDVPLQNLYDGMDAKMDYYSIIPPISTDNQTFDEPFFDLYVPWLRWKIKYLKANGKIDRDGDVDYKEWETGLAALISQETPGQVVNFIPDVDGFLSMTE